MSHSLQHDFDLHDPAEIVRALPCWQGEARVAPLPGGLSNTSFRVEDEAGVHVARLGRDFPFHHVFREREAAASRWAHEAGLAPEVRYHAAGVLVTAFIDGETLDAHGVRARLEPIAALLKHCHVAMRDLARGPAAMFWPFHVARDYAETLRAGGHAISGQLPRLERVAAELEAAQAPMPVVFGHHDLLPANLIDDGRRLWLIDWEYAAFGSPMFDLANLADNADFGPAEERRLLTLYFDREPDGATLKRVFGDEGGVGFARNPVGDGQRAASRYARRRLRDLCAVLPGALRDGVRRPSPESCFVTNLPDHAEIVVIGGGIIGCSTAYHLARDHKADVILLEQNQLTSGSTWHAAGLVGQLRSSASITQVLRYSVALYEQTGGRDGPRHRLEDDGLPAARDQPPTA